jgi:geranylgeranylglycerol-phosphate geranylgeranyltransferase
LGETVWAVLELVRPLNCFLAGVAVVVGGIVAAGGALVPYWIYPLAFLVAAAVAAGGNAINDYFDRDIDKINRPERPIPSRRLSAKKALEIAQFLFVVGILLSAGLMNPYCFALAGLNSIVLTFYSGVLKRRGLLGNLTIGYLVGSTFLFGGLATSVYRVTPFGSGPLVPIELLILVLMAALSTVGRELIKAIQDMPGDKKLKLRTFPLEHGRRKAGGLAIIFVAAAVVLSPIPYLHGIFGRIYLYFLVPAIVSFLVASVIIALNQKPRAAGRASLACKAGMALGLLAFLAGVFFGA